MRLLPIDRYTPPLSWTNNCHCHMSLAGTYRVDTSSNCTRYRRGESANITLSIIKKQAVRGCSVVGRSAGRCVGAVRPLRAKPIMIIIPPSLSHHLDVDGTRSETMSTNHRARSRQPDNLGIRAVSGRPTACNRCRRRGRERPCPGGTIDRRADPPSRRQSSAIASAHDTVATVVMCSERANINTVFYVCIMYTRAAVARRAGAARLNTKTIRADSWLIAHVCARHPKPPSDFLRTRYYVSDVPAL